MVTEGAAQPRYAVGDSVSLTRVFTADDVEAFAALTGDVNPVHVDPAYAATTRFRRPICHGFLVSTLFSRLLGTELPGPGALYLAQDLAFKRPVFPGDQITATITVREVRDDKPVVTLDTVATNDSGAVVIAGQAVMYVG